VQENVGVKVARSVGHFVFRLDSDESADLNDELVWCLSCKEYDVHTMRKKNNTSDWRARAQTTTNGQNVIIATQL
jgi:hypothetical protein